MATESPKERSNEASVTSETEPSIKIEHDPQHVDLDRSRLNGDKATFVTDERENKHLSDIAEDVVQSSEVSISGGSDTEASKGDASRLKDDDKGQVRASTKKPASFKSLSVNKTFLTTKGTTPNAPSKTTEKIINPNPAPTGSLSAARPRLVAKTGSGLVAKSASGINGTKTSSGPDPNAVWNKNRPAPVVPETKPEKLTDEDLQKKYGIHLADRIRPDNAKGQGSNWADIDDDDEDWRPEAITWKDGTKIEIPQAEEVPAPAPMPRPVVETAPAPLGKFGGKASGVADKIKLPAQRTSPSIKPGVLASGKGLVLKGAAEKPTLVAKPQAPPTATKSPWAAIPKFDKVSPLALELSGQPGARSSVKDVNGAKATNQVPKEIAADDFRRTWRDGDNTRNRELYNSQSGQLEPVADNRRSAVRSEAQQGRQPALLQRTSHHDQHGPAEPSAAFQTHRSSDHVMPYGRRRGSSNVSGGSGGYLNRLKSHEQSLPSSEIMNVSRGSIAAVTDSPTPPRNFSPSGQHSGPRQVGNAWQTRPSPGTTKTSMYEQPQTSQAPLPEGRSTAPVVIAHNSGPTEQDIEHQKKLMLEKREAAIKRRQEEEAREEAARKERIRRKLLAMGPAPESKSAKKAAGKVAAAATIKESQQMSSEQQTKRVDTPAKTEDGLKTSLSAKSDRVADSKVSPVSQVSQAPQVPQVPPNSDAVEISSQPQASSHAHPWPNTNKPIERTPSATWGEPVVAKNVWGSPNPTRSLGNGTFSADLGPPKSTALSNKSTPGPIAPPSGRRTVLSPSASTAATLLSSAQQAPIGPPRAPARISSSVTGRSAPGAERKLQAEQARNQWASAVKFQDTEFRAIMDKQFEERNQRLKEEGRIEADVQPELRENWRKTTLNENGHRVEEKKGERAKVVKVDKGDSMAANAEALSHQQATADGRTLHVEPATSSAVVGGTTATSATATPYHRGSRFFPSRDARQESCTTGHPRSSPSPPPPDMFGHPAFDGDMTHPQVSLPKPQPVVRLPPAQVVVGQQAAPSFAWATAVAYREPEAVNASSVMVNSQQVHRQGNAWQAKINNLLSDRKSHSPPKPSYENAVGRGGLAPASAQAPFYHISTFAGVQVWPENDESVISKRMAEECFEEQEMGSLPPVRMPTDVPESAWQLFPAPKALPKKMGPIVTTVEPLTFPQEMSGAGNIMRVLIPGKRKDGGEHTAKLITTPFGRAVNNQRRGSGPRGGRQPLPHLRHRSRETSANHAKEHGSGPPGGNQQQSKNNGRGTYRQHWTRNSSAPILT